MRDGTEGRYTARAADASISTEGDDLDLLRAAIREAVGCHFEDGDRPKLIRLHRSITKSAPLCARLRIGTLASILANVAKHLQITQHVCKYPQIRVFFYSTLAADLFER